jgi:hypothetical protein
VEVCAQGAAVFVARIAVVRAQSDKRPAATNTTSPAPADIASGSGHRRARQRCSAQATNNSVSQAGVATACAVHWVRDRQVTHQQCSLIAIIREAKCHPVNSRASFAWIGRGSRHRGRGHERCEFGQHQSCCHSGALSDIPKHRDSLGHALHQGFPQHDTTA